MTHAPNPTIVVPVPTIRPADPTGVVRLVWTSGTHCYVSTDSGERLDYRGRRYSVSVHFTYDQVVGGWVVGPYAMINRDDPTTFRDDVPRTYRALFIETCRALVAAHSEPDTLLDAERANLTNACEHARRELTDARDAYTAAASRLTTLEDALAAIKEA